MKLYLISLQIYEISFKMHFKQCFISQIHILAPLHKNLQIAYFGSVE